MIDPLTSLAFSVYENKGVYALLLGSGVSRAAQIPTGWEITLDLVRRVALLQGIANQSDWVAWHQGEFGKEPSYSELLDALSTTPDERRSILHSYIEPTTDDIAEGRKIPTRAHHAIARLVQAGFIRVIITTNFDRLIENALREVGVEPTVIKSDDDLTGAVPLLHSRCFILKIHGDYLDTRIKNTDVELGTYSPAANGLLDRIIDEHGLLVCGWSAEWDPALKAAITRAPNRRYPLFWAVRGKLSPVADELIRHRGGKAIPVEDADAFFDKLEAMVAAQADLQKVHPRTIALLVASTKKYLARDEFRIQLDELVGGEVKSIVTATGGQNFTYDGQWSVERFARDVARYEAIAEPLARVFGVLGRYGTGAEFRSTVEIIGRFAVREPIGGLTVLIGLRSYPALILFYSYGIGLLRARRYNELFRLFSYEIRMGRGDNKSLADKLHTEEGIHDNNLWRQLPNLERHKTALSDHLHDLLARWAEDYVFTSEEFTPLFEEFELLGALAYLTRKYTHPELQAELQGAPGQNFVWSPVGRAGWHGQVRQPIIENWNSTEQRQALLDAGFASCQPDFFADAITCINRLSARMNW